MFNKLEIEAIKRGYKITPNGDAISKTGKKIGTCGKNKYMYISFKMDGKIVKVSIHRLQAFQKFGDKIYEDGIEVRHLNAIKTDNSWNNIEIGTHSDNMFDIQKEVRIKKAKNAASFMIKYDEKTVSEIKRFHETTHSYKKTMEKFEISSKGTLYFILNNR